jgi:hypothetical protein
MSLKGLTQLEISKNKISRLSRREELPFIDHNKFVAAIEKHMPFFIWQEDVDILNEEEKEAFQKIMGSSYKEEKKQQARCILVKNKGYYRFSVTYFKELNMIGLINTAQGGMTIELLEIMCDVAELCDCKLYNSDTRYITKERIEREKQLILEKKQNRKVNHP